MGITSLFWGFGLNNVVKKNEKNEVIKVFTVF